MKRRNIHFIIVFSSLSLIAALITQLLWVNDALQLMEDQQSSKVELAMNKVVNQILTLEEFQLGMKDTVDFTSSENSLLSVVQHSCFGFSVAD
jgi:hypothetical protein